MLLALRKVEIFTLSGFNEFCANRKTAIKIIFCEQISENHNTIPGFWDFRDICDQS